ncbi:DUF1563 domain-containing protein [Leptospira santarosai]
MKKIFMILSGFFLLETLGDLYAISKRRCRIRSNPLH